MAPAIAATLLDVLAEAPTVGLKLTGIKVDCETGTEVVEGESVVGTNVEDGELVVGVDVVEGIAVVDGEFVVVGRAVGCAVGEFEGFVEVGDVVVVGRSVG